MFQCQTYIPSGTKCLIRSYLCAGFLCVVIFIPGGTVGVALKYNYPKSYAYANNPGFVLYVLNKLIVISACSAI